MKIRVISGVVGGLLAVLVLVLYHTFVFPLVIAALSCIALFELYRAANCLHCKISMGAGFLYGGLMPFLQFYGNRAAMVAVAFLCVMAMFLELVMLHKRIQYHQTLFLVAVTILVPGSLGMLITLLQGQYGIACVILALCAAWIADTGAYFAGTFFGKNKLCPGISPKKTVEGFFGGIAADIFLMLAFSLVFSLITEARVHYVWLIFTAMVCAGVSVLGDLSASVLKRQQGIKDFGKLMPGHGGIMDRFDSVLFTIPAFYALECVYPIFY